MLSWSTALPSQVVVSQLPARELTHLGVKVRLVGQAPSGTSADKLGLFALNRTRIAQRSGSLTCSPRHARPVVSSGANGSKSQVLCLMLCQERLWPFLQYTAPSCMS